jgi:hypothetical protein
MPEALNCVEGRRKKLFTKFDYIEKYTYAYLTILKRAWSANLKMVWYVLLRSLRPELDGLLDE